MLPPPQNTNFWALLKRWHMVGNITQIGDKLNTKHTKQIHQWHVGVIGFTIVHLRISCQCKNNVIKALCPFLQNAPFAFLAIHVNRYCVHKLIKHSISVLCFFTISNIEHRSRDQCRTKHTVWSIVSLKYVPNYLCAMTFPVVLQTTVLLIYFDFFFIHCTWQWIDIYQYSHN